MFYYRVTKYNPDFRNSQGAYVKEEWTSIGDVGRYFNGKIFTYQDYLQVENNYIYIINSIFLELNISELQIKNFEDYGNKFSSSLENSIINSSQWSDYFRKSLREEIWCKYENGNNFIHFGYDYYMYVGVETEPKYSISLAEQLNIFIEEKISPYLYNE